MHDSNFRCHSRENGALLHGSKKVPYVILAKGGNPGFLALSC
ncbi:hypothetical protein [Rickettsia endosymbiont of Orchestes rusci]